MAALAAASAVPLAAGENAIGDEAFDALIASRAVAVVQPDLAKWGGVSGVLAVVDRIARRRACAGARITSVPASAWLASAHVARRPLGSDDGLLEVDANENPLRTRLCPPLATSRRSSRRSTGTLPASASPRPPPSCARWRRRADRAARPVRSTTTA